MVGLMRMYTTKERDAAVLQARTLLARTRAELLRSKSGGPSGKAGDIVAEIESRLISGHYHFGDSLSINRLAEEFDASRQPISAALNHLRSLGYLTITPQVGCHVVSPSTLEINDFFYMLGKIQSAVAGLAAERHVDEESDVLTALAKHIWAVSIEHDSREELTLGVDAYHQQVLSMARSPALEQRVTNLWHLADFYLWQGVSNLDVERINAANSERRFVAEAIASRDIPLAEQLMENHVRGKPHRLGIV
ncbi:MAG: DNA-binding GntR family transcriptional regulator [Gammaproteobacteria bacterium]|jgi:DNA-binding GntR family transcriptional regulator